MKIETILNFSPDEYLKLPSNPSSQSGEKDLLLAACQRLSLKVTKGLHCVILKKSIDARKKRPLLIQFRLLITDEKLESSISSAGTRNPPNPRPVVIGFGPAGMFAALLLARKGLCPIVIERGRTVQSRVQDVERYFTSGQLCSSSNIQFGEGGAGTFSDGKLNTGVSDQRKRYILESLVKAGAPENILYASHPHVGTDYLIGVVTAIREEIISLGGEFLFERTVVNFRIENNRIVGIYHQASVGTATTQVNEAPSSEYLCANNVILAIGHSARDTLAVLHELALPMAQKPFSVGLRIEHLQSWLDHSQYGTLAGHLALSPAEYKLVAHCDNGRSLYTFCMCPGGYVVAGSSVEDGVVTNGMSYFKRAGTNSNSAILVGVEPKDFGSSHVLAGIRFQEQLERLAFTAGGSDGKAPCQRLEDFLEDRVSITVGQVKPTYRPGVKLTNLRSILPDFISQTICAGIVEMNRKIPGFSNSDSLLTGIETRSSSTVRILRNDNLQSDGAWGLFPCGEGAGYAGGIMSSAIDGLRCAEKVIEKNIPKTMVE